MITFFVFRNCFTGDISGGDMHTGGFCSWITKTTSNELYLVHPNKDGQAEVYNEVSNINNITYKRSKLESLHVLIMLIMRSIYGYTKVSLPKNRNRRVFVAGSHFIADVLPVIYHANREKDYKVVYIHHIIQDMPRQKSIRNFVALLMEKYSFNKIKKHYDMIITVNEGVTNRLKDMGFTQEIVTSSNFVDVPSGAVKSIEAKIYDLVFCGRMMPQKGVYDFLKVVKSLSYKNPEFKAAMIGAGPESKEIKKQIHDKNIPIDFIGRASNEVKFQTIANSKVFLFPSTEEGWGIVVAESFAVGTPVIAYDLPVYQEIFKGNVITVPLNDYLSLLETTTRYLGIGSADYITKQKKVTEFAKRFTIDQVIKKEYEMIKKGVNLL